MRVFQLAFSGPFEIGGSWACVHLVSIMRLTYWVYAKEMCCFVGSYRRWDGWQPAIFRRNEWIERSRRLV